MILWELPLSIGFQLQHAVIVMNGARTVESASTMLARHEALKEMVADG